MRDAALLLGFLSMLAMGRVFRYPHVGVLLWCWTALVVPGSFSYSFAIEIPYNKIVAIITLVVWMFSREPKTLPANATLVLLAVFALWGTVSALTAIAGTEYAMIEWENFIKIIIFAFVVAGLMNSKDRIFGLLYAAVLSLGFHGTLAGAKYIASGGSSHLYGPGESIIGDNNAFALAMVALLPIIFYLRAQFEHRLMRLASNVAIVLVGATIMGTASRGGFLGLAAVGALAFMRSPKKLRNAAIAIPLIVTALALAPERWSERMDTIKEVGQDGSMERVIAWKQSTLIAFDHPFFGGGFYAVQDYPTWIKYAQEFRKLDFIPTAEPTLERAVSAHSIYFQVLGDLGFVGLALFLAILASSWRNAAAIIRATRDRPEWHWARDLAKALQYTIFAYMVAGAALNMAYFDFMYMVFALLVAMRRLLSQSIAVADSSVVVRAVKFSN